MRKLTSFWLQANANKWRVLLGIVVFYLIRDLLLYVVMPFLVYRSLF